MSETNVVELAVRMRASAEEIRPAPQDAPTRGVRPVIEIVGGELPAVVDKAEEALEADADHPIYQRGGQLVAVVSLEAKEAHGGIVRESGSPMVMGVQTANLVERMTRAADFRKHSAREQRWRPVDAPQAVASALLARGTWRFPQLVAIAETPRLRPDGTILDRAGFDPLTGIVYVPSAEFPEIPTSPSPAQAAAAASELLEVVVDFPFQNDEHSAAWLAALLTPFARPAFQGPAPLFLIDKNVHGAGGSLLADLIGLVVTGREMSRAVHPRDDEEMRKRITSSALSGDELILMDNVTGTLGGAALNAALTGTTWRDRVLGASEMTPSLPLVATWYATSNNAALDRDTTRRALPIRLDSPLERPEERDGFLHPDLRSWVRAERPRLVRAALTVLRGYFASGARPAHLKPWGSYEGWSSVVRQAVVFGGLPDPCRTRTEFVVAADSERLSLIGLLDGLEELDPHGFGLTAAEILRRLDQSQDDHRGLREAILDLCPARDGRPFLPTARVLGKRLQHLRRRVVDGRLIDRIQKTQGTAGWRVRKASEIVP